MKVLKATLALFICVIFNLQGQDGNTGSNQMLLNEINNVMMTTGTTSGGKIEGSPYLKESFEAANVIGYDNVIYNVRYNVYTDEIEVKIADGSIKKINSSLDNLIVKTTISKTVFEPLNYINRNRETKKGFLISLTPNYDEIKLYLKKSKRFVEAKPAQSGYDKDEPAKFKDENDEYFIKYGEGYPVQVPRKKKDLAKIFKDKEDKAMDFIKENRIKSNKKEDLISLVNYINSI